MKTPCSTFPCIWDKVLLCRLHWTGTHYKTQGGFKLMVILLPHVPNYWDDRCIQPFLALCNPYKSRDYNNLNHINWQILSWGGPLINQCPNTGISHLLTPGITYGLLHTRCSNIPLCAFWGCVGWVPYVCYVTWPLKQTYLTRRPNEVIMEMSRLFTSTCNDETVLSQDNWSEAVHGFQNLPGFEQSFVDVHILFSIVLIHISFHISTDLQGSIRSTPNKSSAFPGSVPTFKWCLCYLKAFKVSTPPTQPWRWVLLQSVEGCWP